MRLMASYTIISVFCNYCNEASLLKSCAGKNNKMAPRFNHEYL